MEREQICQWCQTSYNYQSDETLNQNLTNKQKVCSLCLESKIDYQLSRLNCLDEMEYWEQFYQAYKDIYSEYKLITFREEVK